MRSHWDRQENKVIGYSTHGTQWKSKSIDASCNGCQIESSLTCRNIAPVNSSVFLYSEVESDPLSSSRGCAQEKEPSELTFRLLVKAKEREGPAVSIVLMAPSAKEKAAWTTDIGQVNNRRHTHARGTDHSLAPHSGRMLNRNALRSTGMTLAAFPRSLMRCKLYRWRCACWRRFSGCARGEIMLCAMPIGALRSVQRYIVVRQVEENCCPY